MCLADEVLVFEIIIGGSHDRFWFLTIEQRFAGIWTSVAPVLLLTASMAISIYLLFSIYLI